MIARDVSDPFHIQILQGINDAARAREYRLFLGHAGYQPEAAIAYGSMVERSHADGIIVIGDIEGGDPALDILAAQHRFVVGVTDRDDPPANYRRVRRQRRGHPARDGPPLGARAPRDHLRVGLPHLRRPAAPRSRRALYARLRRRRGDPRLRTDQEPEPAHELGQRIFGEDVRSHPATAVYATSDTTAIGLMQAAFQAGIAIPDRLSMVGYDDIDMAPYPIPPLTTISRTGVEMGRVAMELLFRMIDQNLNREEVSDVILAPRLLVRQSTAPHRVGVGRPPASELVTSSLSSPSRRAHMIRRR